MKGDDKPTGILTTNKDGTIDYKVINEWQLCPKCNGTGLMLHHQMWNNYSTISTAPCTCDVCEGKKIISKINGLPPE